jgi:hypothetical protein
MRYGGYNLMNGWSCLKRSTMREGTYECSGRGHTNVGGDIRMWEGTYECERGARALCRFDQTTNDVDCSVEASEITPKSACIEHALNKRKHFEK